MSLRSFLTPKTVRKGSKDVFNLPNDGSAAQRADSPGSKSPRGESSSSSNGTGTIGRSGTNGEIRRPVKPLPQPPVDSDGEEGMVGGARGASGTLGGGECSDESLGLEERIVTRRAQIAEEVWASEKSFNDAMAMIVDVYSPSLQQCQLKCVTREKRAALLCNIDEVVSVSSSLLLTLRRRAVDSWPTHSCLGDVFVAFAPRFRCYAEYIRHHRDAILTLNSLDARKDFSAWMKEVEEQHPGIKSLANLLIQPVQRMTRYVMLLSSLLEKTPPSHPDHAPLTRALSLVEDIVTSTDGAIERHENLQKAYQIARRLGLSDLLSREDRLYVRDGSLMKVCRKQDKERWFVLFSDILIYAAFDPTKLSMKSEQLRLDRTSVAPATSPANAFSIRSEQKSFVVYAPSEAERKEWMDAINGQITKNGGNANSVNHAPVWTPDKESACCSLCKAEFTLIYRRHHCRKCGVLVCGKCSSYKMVVKNIDPVKPVRVCDRCLMSQ